MKKLILLLVTCTSIYSLPAQHYDLPSKDLNAKFVEIYSQTDKNKNLFERLSETNDFFFSGLDTVFELNREIVLQHAAAFKRPGDNYLFPETNVTISAEKAITHSQFCILTTITVYNTIQLRTDECSLTMPLKLIEFKDPFPEKVKCNYETGENPGVRFSI